MNQLFLPIGVVVLTGLILSGVLVADSADNLVQHRSSADSPLHVIPVIRLGDRAGSDNLTIDVHVVNKSASDFRYLPSRRYTDWPYGMRFVVTTLENKTAGSSEKWVSKQPDRSEVRVLKPGASCTAQFVLGEDVRGLKPGTYRVWLRYFVGKSPDKHAPTPIALDEVVAIIDLGAVETEK